MKWFFQASVSDCSIPRLFRLSITLLLARLPHNSFYRFWIIHYVSPSSWTYHLPPPIFYPSTSLLYLFALGFLLHFLPGFGATVHLDGATARLPPPLICASLPYWAAQRSSSCKPCLPSPIWLPSFPSSTCVKVPIRPKVILSMGPFLPLPASIHLTPPTPPP